MSHLLPLDPSIDYYGSTADAQWPYQRADEQPRPDHDASYEVQYSEDSPDDSSLSPTETVFYQHQYYPGFVTQSGFTAQDSHASPPSAEAYAEEPYGTRETYYADELNQPPLQYASYPAHAPPFARADPQQMASILGNHYSAPSYGMASQFQELVAASGGLAVAAMQGHAVNESHTLRGAHWPEGPAAAASYVRSSHLPNPGYEAIHTQHHEQPHVVSPVFIPQAAHSSGNHESYGNHSGGDSPMGHLPYADTALPFTNIGQYQESAEPASSTSASSSPSFNHFYSESPSIKQEEVDTTADFAKVSASRMHADTLKLHASTLSSLQGALGPVPDTSYVPAATSMQSRTPVPLQCNEQSGDPVQTPEASASACRHGPRRRSSGGIVKKPKKEQFLACFFCRGRKIACGPPPADCSDRTCNQCARRHLVCEYPLKSRRGQRRPTPRVLDIADGGPRVRYVPRRASPY